MAKLITRARRMSSHLGYIPTPTEFKDRFKDKGTKISINEARSVFMKIKNDPRYQHLL